MNKATGVLAAALIIALSASSISMAQGMGRGMGMGKKNVNSRAYCLQLAQERGATGSTGHGRPGRAFMRACRQGRV